MVIAKLDSTKNEIEGVDIEGFPTIKMFKKETNEEVEYVGRKKILCLLATGDSVMLIVSKTRFQQKLPLAK